MKNSKGFYTTSTNCAARGGEDMAAALILARKITAAGFSPYDAGVEWHHASANRIAFFANSDEDFDKIRAFEKAVEEKLAAQADLPKSKAAVWRGLVDNDRGFGGVDYKDGKYGRFVCTFGTPDGRQYFPSADFAEKAKRLLKI